MIEFVHKALAPLDCICEIGYLTVQLLNKTSPMPVQSIVHGEVAAKLGILAFLEL